MLLFFIVLAMMFYLSSDVKTTRQAVGALLKAQLLAVFLPTLLIALLAKINLRETFSDSSAPRVVRPPPGGDRRHRERSSPRSLFYAGASCSRSATRRDSRRWSELIQADMPRLEVCFMPARRACRRSARSCSAAASCCRPCAPASASEGSGRRDDRGRSSACFISTCTASPRRRFAAGLMLGYICVRTGSVVQLRSCSTWSTTGSSPCTITFATCRSGSRSLPRDVLAGVIAAFEARDSRVQGRSGRRERTRSGGCGAR